MNQLWLIVTIQRFNLFENSMKLAFSKIAGMAFLINSTLIVVLDVAHRWNTIDFTDVRWLQRVLWLAICSPLGLYTTSDILSVVTPVILFVLAALAFMFDAERMNNLKGGLLMILMVFEVLKLLLLFGFSSGINIWL